MQAASTLTPSSGQQLQPELKGYSPLTGGHRPRQPHPWVVPAASARLQLWVRLRPVEDRRGPVHVLVDAVVVQPVVYEAEDELQAAAARLRHNDIQGDERILVVHTRRHLQGHNRDLIHQEGDIY